MIEAGKHRARAVEWGVGEAGTGTMQIGVVFELLDQEPGTYITYYGYFTDGALEFTLKALRAMGWQGSDITELDNNGGGLDQREVQIVVEHEEYQGRIQTKVKWVNSLGGMAMANRVTGDKLASFAAGLRGKIMGLEPGRRAAPAAGMGQTQPAARPTRPQDDIPF